MDKIVQLYKSYTQYVIDDLYSVKELIETFKGVSEYNIVGKVFYLLWCTIFHIPWCIWSHIFFMTALVFGWVVMLPLMTSIMIIVYVLNIHIVPLFKKK